MSAFFTQQDWDRIRSDYAAWWAQQTDRPLIHLFFTDNDPKMPRPKGLITESLYQYGPEESADSIAEKMEYIHRSRRYVLDGYPLHWLYFGPVSTVEYIGCKAHFAPDTVWFTPRHPMPAAERTIAPDPESQILPRESAIRAALQRRYGKNYVVSNPCGGGYALDVVAEFYGHEQLSYMLYDEPEQVKRLMEESDRALREIGRLQRPLTPGAIGYTTWGGLFHEEPWCTAQCDYCAMIGPEHFDEFALPDIQRCMARSPEANYYHLDGPGEIIHMDKILAIPELKCMQWVAAPGGDPELDYQVYSRIFRAGKNMWVTGSLEQALEVARRNGTARGIYWYGAYPMAEYDRVMRIADEIMKI